MLVNATTVAFATVCPPPQVNATLPVAPGALGLEVTDMSPAMFGEIAVTANITALTPVLGTPTLPVTWYTRFVFAGIGVENPPNPLRVSASRACKGLNIPPVPAGGAACAGAASGTSTAENPRLATRAISVRATTGRDDPPRANVRRHEPASARTRKNIQAIIAAHRVPIEEVRSDPEPMEADMIRPLNCVPRRDETNGM